MRKIYAILMGALVALGFSACTATPTIAEQNKGQNVQIFSAPNADGKLTPKTVGKAFESVGMIIDGNNNMNSPFSKRFKHIHYKTYNLAMYRNSELSYKLLKKSPKFGRLIPLTMSIWSDDEKHTLNIATLSLDGLSRTSGIPTTDPDLIAYSQLINKALKAAMPNGKFQLMTHKVQDPKDSYEQTFVMDVELEEDASLDDFKEDFEAEFEGELEPLGFLLPGYLNLKDEFLEEKGDDTYDFYDTYSICKFDVIYPVSRATPEAGAYAPCSFYVYKKKGENKMHMGYLGVDNWIKTLDITDKEAVFKLREAQGFINNILKEMSE